MGLGDGVRGAVSAGVAADVLRRVREWSGGAEGGLQRVRSVDSGAAKFSRRLAVEQAAG